MTITNKREPMSLQNIQEVCSSAFTLASAPNVSNNYTHIPTSQVIEDMIELGWTPVSAQEVRARKGRGYQKHIIRFQNQNIMIKGNDGDDVFPELLLTNSHDGKNAFHLRVGLYRLVCSTMSLYFAIKGRILEAILFMTYAIYNKLDTKD